MYGYRIPAVAKYGSSGSDSGRMWSRLAHIYIREEDLLKDLPPPYISTITTRITITAVRPSLTMSDLLYADMTYCSLCDRYFPGEEARAQHVQLSPNHPQCERCNRRFANKNSLRNVLRLILKSSTMTDCPVGLTALGIFTQTPLLCRL